MNRRTQIYLVFLVFLIALIVPNFYKSENKFNTFSNNVLKTSALSGRIYINNNWTEVKSDGICTGEGTSSNPYLIKNLIIDAGGLGNGIFIGNSSEYFKIENCTVFNSALDTNYGGINLNYVQNGILVNNTSRDNYHGIKIWSSINIQIIRNRINNNIGGGIELVYTNNSILYLNTVINNLVAIGFWWSFNEYNSREKFTYTYQGNTYTNYLGNFWSGYSGIDENGDGIGDTPFHIGSHFHNATLTDNFPLIGTIDNYSNISLASGIIPGYHIFSLIFIISLTIVFLVKIFYRKR